MSNTYDSPHPRAFQMPETLRFTSVQAQNSESVVAEIAAYIGRKLGLQTEFVDGVAWTERERMLDAGEIHVGWICSLPYTWRVGSGIELLAAPVMQGERYRDQPIYFSDVVVRAESSSRSFEDLRGTRWAYNEPHSHSGYNVVRYHMGQSGVGNDFFGAVIESGAHQESLRMILDGEVDASAIDSMVLEREVALRPARYEGRLRTVATLGPSPAPPWVTRRDLPAELRRVLQWTLIEMHECDEGRRILRDGQTARFAAVTDRDYDLIREMEKTAANVLLFP
jgi:phosphonate transport system substrate-binding protein